MSATSPHQKTYTCLKPLWGKSQKENSEQKAGWGKRFSLQAGCSGGSLQTFSLKFRGRCYRHRLESNYIQSSKRCYGICLQSSHQQPRNTWQLGKVGENCGFQMQTLHPLSFHPRPPPLQLQSGFGPRKIYLQTRPGPSLPSQNSCRPGLEGLTFHSDLEGWKVGGGSIPPEIVVTSQRPDLVILDKRKTQTQTHHPLRVANFVANFLLIPFLYKELGITSYIWLSLQPSEVKLKLYRLCTLKVNREPNDEWDPSPKFGTWVPKLGSTW